MILGSIHQIYIALPAIIHPSFPCPQNIKITIKRYKMIQHSILISVNKSFTPQLNIFYGMKSILSEMEKNHNVIKIEILISVSMEIQVT